jgi:GTP:adenosylcobinamide-phosphate guanylyltransferase
VVAVITAGGTIDGAYARLAGTDRKALAYVRGRTMLERAIEALRASGARKIAVVGDATIRAACAHAVDRIVPDAGSGAGNVLAALDAWPEDGESLLYLTCDLPYVEAASLQWFLQRVDARALAMPLCEHADYLRRFDGAPTAGIALNGERVVNAGVFHIPAGARGRVRSFATALFDARKAPWKMAGIAGPLALVRFAFGTLSVGALEARAQRVLDLPVMAVRHAPPELAFDADTADDYAYAIAHV